jgi:hypothetical protein
MVLKTARCLCFLNSSWAGLCIATESSDPSGRYALLRYCAHHAGADVPTYEFVGITQQGEALLAEFSE